MTPKRLRPVVKRHGGTAAFAAKMRVSRRIVQYWVAGERRIRPTVADRIRDLDAADNPTLRPVTQQKER